MKKSENLVATLLVIYAIILTLCIAIYAIFKLLEVDITLASNLLIWSATIFAPIAVLMTYTDWREQKNAENMSRYSEEIYKGFFEYFTILESYPLIFSEKAKASRKTDELDYHFRKISNLVVLYCEFLKSIQQENKILDLQKMENQHLMLILRMQILNEELDELTWYESLNEFAHKRDDVIYLLKNISQELAERFLYSHI